MNFIQPSFAAGELSPSLFGRVDFSKFHSALSTARNGFISYRGGFYSRAGTAFCGFSKQTGRSVAPRMITFQFSINQGLALEFGHLYMRVLSNGAFVTEPATVITGITRANPGVVTDVAHGYANGDWVYLSGIVGMTQLNGQTLVVANVTANTYTLTDVYGTPINTTSYSIYFSGGTAARIYTLVTTYGENDLPFLKFTQSADVMTLTCWNQNTGNLYSPKNLVRIADDNWTITTVPIGSSTSRPTSCSGSANVIASIVTKTDFQYVATAVDKFTSEESRASPIADIPNSVDIATTAGSINVQWSAVAGAGYYNIYKAPPAYKGTVPVGSLFGYCGTAYGTSFVDSNIVPDFAQVPPLHQNPFATGAVLLVNITGGGSGLTTVTWTVTTAGGSGFDGYPVIVGGVLTAFVIINSGNGYLPGDSIAFNGAGFATGAIDFTASGNPTAGDTITLNGVVWTFVAAITAANQTLIQVDLATTLNQLATDLTASAVGALLVANYTASAMVLTVQYKTAGAAGNSYTLAASVATPSGATLTGGTGAGGATTPSATLLIGPQTGVKPSVVTYFQERIVYASTPNQPDTYFMSQPGLFNNFDQRIPTIDSDAIIGTPWSVQVDGIQFMQPMPGGLVVLTGRQAWQLTGAGGSSLNPQPITPAGQEAQPQAYNGCNNHVPPITIDADINYVQAKGSVLRNLAYNYFVNIYTGTDLTYLSSQLFTGYEIVEMAWCEEPYKIIWVVRNDGVLLSLTYLKSQDVMAWARQDTNGNFVSVCSVTEPPVDALYTAVQRFPGGNTAYMIERMDNRIWQSAEQTWCVDAALTLTLPEPNARLTASSATGAGTPTGVTGLVGGSGYSTGTVGSIVDPTGSGATVNLTIVAGVITAVGFVGGTLYTYPQLVFTDPAGTGSGASANVTLNNSATFTASSAVFSAPQVGQVIRMGGGKATITAFTNATHVTANITSPIIQLIPNSGGMPAVAQSGTWSLAPNVTTIGGLWHLIGATVTGVADGAVIPPTVVAADGTITLGTPASLVTVGLGFQVQAQSLYLDTGQPTVQGRRKKISAVTARLESSGVATVQAYSNQPDGSTQSPPQNAPVWTNPATLTLPPNQGLPPYGGSIPPLYTGDVRVPVSGGFQKPGQVALQQNAPLPLQILAFISEAFEGDQAETEAKPDPARHAA